MRNVFAVMLGAMVAFGVVAVGDAAAGQLFALPTIAPGTDPAVAKSLMEAAIAKAPLGAMLTMVAGYFVASFAGGFIARKVGSGGGAQSMIVGFLVLTAVILNFSAIQHPTLMVALGVLMPLPGAWLGAKMA
jgi:hypothetical protein